MQTLASVLREPIGDTDCTDFPLRLHRVLKQDPDTWALLAALLSPKDEVPPVSVLFSETLHRINSLKRAASILVGWKRRDPHQLHLTMPIQPDLDVSIQPQLRVPDRTASDTVEPDDSVDDVRANQSTHDPFFEELIVMDTD
jgi:hypothetical protein